MFGFFRRNKSKDDLKNRLKVVLSYDRAGVTPGKMEEMKEELMAVISKYFPSTNEEFDVKLEKQGDRMVFVANLPMQSEPTS